MQRGRSGSTSSRVVYIRGTRSKFSPNGALPSSLPSLSLSLSSLAFPFYLLSYHSQRRLRSKRRRSRASFSLGGSPGKRCDRLTRRDPPLFAFFAFFHLPRASENDAWGLIKKRKERRERKSSLPRGRERRLIVSSGRLAISFKSSKRVCPTIISSFPLSELSF